MVEPQGVPLRIVVLLAVAVFINYVDRGNLATAGPLLKDELGLSNAQFGALGSAFFLSYAPLQLVAGWLAQRFDVRYVLAAGLIVWAIATALVGLVTSFAALLALRLLLGVGESVTYPCNSKLLAQRAPEHQRGRANGVIAGCQALGQPSARWSEDWSWSALDGEPLLLSLGLFRCSGCGPGSS